MKPNMSLPPPPVPPVPPAISENNADSYTASKIIGMANEKIERGDVGGAEMMYAEALLDWVDDAREGNASVDEHKMETEIASLWCAYADFFYKLKKFKSAFEAYENATQCPISGSCGRIWREYAKCCRLRKRPRHAQKVYMRALVGESGKGAVVNETEKILLWNDFLSLSKETSHDPNLSMEELMNAVRVEQQQQQQQQQQDAGRPTKIPKLDHPSQEPTLTLTPTPSTTTSAGIPGVAPPSLPQHTQPQLPPPLIPMGLQLQQPPPMNALSSTATVTATATSALTTILQQALPPPTHTHTHTQSQEPLTLTTKAITDRIALESKSLSETMSTELMASWLASDGDSPPTPPDPPLFTAHPPKLSDPSGKHVVGRDLAIAILKRLCQKDSESLLATCRGCWILTSLTEQHIVRALQRTEESMERERVSIENRLATRLASAADPVVAVAVRQTNDAERSDFHRSMESRRLATVGSVAWEHRRLLAVQQCLLTKAQVPGFHGPTVDHFARKIQAGVCAVLHSAFYLQGRIGHASHQTMLHNTLHRLIREEPPPPPALPPPVFLPPPPPPPPPSAR